MSVVSSRKRSLSAVVVAGTGMPVVGATPRSSARARRTLTTDRGTSPGPPGRSAARAGTRSARAAWSTASARRRRSRGRPARRGSRRPAPGSSAARFAPTPPCGQPSSTITQRLVLRTDARIVSRSSGRSVRGSMTSASIVVLVGEPSRRLLGGERHARDADDRHVVALAADRGLAEVDDVVARRRAPRRAGRRGTRAR